MESDIWFSKALEDFDTAKYNIKGKKLNAGLFFLQQSAEKALKSLYIKNFRELLRTHDLVLIAKKVNAPEDVLNYCKNLSPAYQYTRYPDSVYEEFDKNNIEDFIKYCGEVLKWVEENLKKK